MYEISIERGRGLIRLVMAGFLDIAEAIAMTAEVQEAIVSAGCPFGGHLLLVDVRGCALQSQVVVGVLQAAMEKSPRKARRIAIITGGVLARMQAKRAVLRDHTRMFEDLAEGEAWLLEGATLPWPGEGGEAIAL